MIVHQIIAILFCGITIAHSQELVNVQVKAYDMKLRPLPDLELSIEDTIRCRTNLQGLAFIGVPPASLPPRNIDVFDNDLRVESWNYSKGILEILVSERQYSQLNVSVLYVNTQSPLSGVKVKVKGHSPSILTTDEQGKISLTVSGDIEFKNAEFFQVDGYEINQQKWDETGGTLLVARKKVVSGKEESLMANTTSKQSDQLPASEDLGVEDLDSIASLTVFYSLLKNVNYNDLDEESRKKMDRKYDELILNNAPVPPVDILEGITDSSLIDQDIQLIIEKIYQERDLLNHSKEQFEMATDFISAKLRYGGTNLSSEERRDLIQLVLSIKEMLKKNEEYFFKNNAYYEKEVESLLGQLANIHELEDMLKESEETSIELRSQLMYSMMTLIIILAITGLLVYLVRLLRRQKRELAKANQEVKRMNENLEGIVSEKTQSLELINHELDTFIYRSSHNLRRPITSIRGLANIAQITLNKEAMSLFDKVVFTTNEMEKMLNKLAMMSYINQPTDFGDIDLHKIVDNLRSEFSAIIENKNILFNVDIPADIQFKSYPFVIESMLFNLLENACFFSQYKHNSRSTVDLTITCNENRDLCISVKDNGCGIKPEVQDKIWNMFFIGNESSKGNGLGLFIAKKGVESLKGSIKLDTEAGKYTEFMISLPMPESIEEIRAAN